jgi:nicotinamide mononucleotide adenylyltransferase
MKNTEYLHGYLHNQNIEQKVQLQGSFDVRSLLEISWAIVLHSIRHVPAIVTQNGAWLRISPELSYEAAHAPLHPQSEVMRKPRRALLAAALVSIIPAFVFLVPSDTIPQAIRPCHPALMLSLHRPSSSHG